MGWGCPQVLIHSLFNLWVSLKWSFLIHESPGHEIITTTVVILYHYDTELTVWQAKAHPHCFYPYISHMQFNHSIDLYLYLNISVVYPSNIKASWTIQMLQKKRNKKIRTVWTTQSVAIRGCDKHRRKGRSRTQNQLFATYQMQYFRRLMETRLLATLANSAYHWNF